MRQPSKQTNAPSGEAPASSRAGLILCGEVVGRRRRQVVVKNGAVRFIITLKVMAGMEIMSCDRWADGPSPSDVPLIGAAVEMPVRLRQFATKTGMQIRLDWGPPNDEQDF